MLQEMPFLGLGTYGISREDEVIIKHAIDMGYRHIDTAQFYNNEIIIKNAIRACSVERGNLFITSKIWNTSMSYANTIKATLNMIDVLGISYFDLLLVHWPHPDHDFTITLEAMSELFHHNKIKRIGVSNFDKEQLKQAMKITDIYCVQNEIHPYYYDMELINYAQQMNIKLVAYTPFAQGRVFHDQELGRLSRKKGCKISTIILSWLKKQGINAVLKSSNLVHLSENLQFTNIEINAQEFEEIMNMFDGKKIIKRSYME